MCDLNYFKHTLKTHTGTQPGLEMNVGDRVRWYFASIGKFCVFFAAQKEIHNTHVSPGADHSVHTPHIHGHTFDVSGGGRNDQVDLLAGSSVTGDMIAENEGRWQLHCHVNDHKKAGMISLYDVGNETSSTTSCDMDVNGVVREYFVQIEEVEWSYYDGDDAYTNMCASPSVLTDDSVSKRSVESNEVDRLGTNFTKARYVQYTDATYTVRVQEDDELGLLGPTLRAIVGDRIVVHARNALSDRNVSLHPHGVQYGKDAEGAPYLDGSVGVDGDDYIEPGQEYTYTWCVPSSAGPGDSDGSSIVWLFHDHVHEINGTNAGLIGTIIVSSRDSANVVDAKPTDVDKEIVLLFASLNELSSLYVVTSVTSVVLLRAS